MVKHDGVDKSFWSVRECICILYKSVHDVVIPIDIHNLCGSKCNSENIPVPLTKHPVRLYFSQIQTKQIAK